MLYMDIYMDIYIHTYIYIYMDMLWNILLVSWGKLSQLSSPNYFCPSLLAGRAAGEAEKAFPLCKHCPAKASLCYQHCFGHISRAAQ